MNLLSTIARLACGIIFTSTLIQAAEKPTPVASVDLAKYQGAWYEVAAFESWFERGCRNATATYTVLKNGKVEVINQCLNEKGKIKKVTGIAKAVPGSGNTKLKVSFFRPFYGDYWIIGLDPNYQWAVVGHPDKKYLWLLSRKPTIAKPLYDKMAGIAKAQGYDTRKLQLTGAPVVWKPGDPPSKTAVILKPAKSTKPAAKRR